jgi:hypothetical protein
MNKYVDRLNEITGPTPGRIGGYPLKRMTNEDRGRRLANAVGLLAIASGEAFASDNEIAHKKIRDVLFYIEKIMNELDKDKVFSGSLKKRFFEVKNKTRLP